MSGLHRVRGLRPAQRRGPPAAVRRVRHILPHLLHGPSAGLRSAGQLEVQVVRHLPGVRIQRPGLQFRMEQQLFHVRAVRFVAGEILRSFVLFVRISKPLEVHSGSLFGWSVVHPCWIDLHWISNRMSRDGSVSESIGGCTHLLVNWLISD